MLVVFGVSVSILICILSLMIIIVIFQKIFSILRCILLFVVGSSSVRYISNSVIVVFINVDVY